MTNVHLYHRHRFPPDVIAYTVWLYFRFPLSLRMVEDLLAESGIIVSHQTIRACAEKFGRKFAKTIRRRSAGRLGDKWHLDEVVISIGAVSTGFGVLSMRRGSCWMYWFKPAATGKPPFG